MSFGLRITELLCCVLMSEQLQCPAAHGYLDILLKRGPKLSMLRILMLFMSYVHTFSRANTLSADQILRGQFFLRTSLEGRVYLHFI
jgi:hypothetical protein